MDEMLSIFLQIILLRHFFVEADVTSVVGSTISLYCTLSPTQTQKVQWFKGTTALSYGNLVLPDLKPDEFRNRLRITIENGKYHLTISNSVKTDEGQYKCSIGGTVDTEQKLIVIVGPTSVSFENKNNNNRIQGTEGQDLSIKCTAFGGDLKPDIIIKTETTGQEYIGTLGVKELIIPTIDRAFDGSQVTCRTDYSKFSGLVYEPLNDATQIYLNLKPLPPTFSPDLISTENTKQLVLYCTSKGSRPNPTHRIWSLGDSNVDITSSSTRVSYSSDPSKPDTFLATSTLTYTIDKQYNGKNISCGFSNIVTGNDFVKSSKPVEVKYAPEIIVDGKTFEPTQTSREIQCVLDGNPSTYTYGRWEHKSKYGDHIRYLPAAPTLTLPVVSEAIRYQDTGEYVCIANNGIVNNQNQLEQKGSGYVVSNAPPFFLNRSSQEVLGLTRYDVTIDVSVYSEPSYTTIIWYKDGSPIKQNINKYVISAYPVTVVTTFHRTQIQVDGYRLTLNIKNLQEDDFTNYTVKVSNGVGEQMEYMVTLKPVRPPDLPTHFNVTDILTSSVLLKWKPGFNGGSEQYFIIQYRKIGSNLWTSIKIDNTSASSFGDMFLLTLNGLDEGTYYAFRMYAENIFNSSSYTDALEISTMAKAFSEEQNVSNVSQALVAGIAAGLSSIILILVASNVFLLLRLKECTCSKQTNKQHKGNATETTEHYLDVSDDIRSNPPSIHSSSEENITSPVEYEELGMRDQPNVYSKVDNAQQKSDNESRFYSNQEKKIT